MGFFGELKQDLSQAVNELMPEDEFNDESTRQEERSLGEMLENIDDIQIPEEETGTAEEMSEPGETALSEETTVSDEAEPAAAVDDIVSEETFWEPQETRDAAEESEDGDEIDLESMLEDVLAEEDQPQEISPAADIVTETEPFINENKGDKKIMDTFSGTREVVDETSIITMGMTITGDISSEGSVDIVGNVNGNIEILGKLNVTGHINGNSKASEVYADGAKINGEIVSEGAVKIGASTVIIGNITASSAAIAGAVKGDIDVKGPVILDASAIVMGNIKSKSVQINNGAVIEGMCSQCYADISPTAFFEDYKTEVKKEKAKTSK